MVNQVDPENTQYDIGQTTVIPTDRTIQNVPDQVVYDPEAAPYEWPADMPDVDYDIAQQAALDAQYRRSRGPLARWEAMETWKKAVSIVAASIMVIMGIVALDSMFAPIVMEVKEPQTVVPYHEEEVKKPNADLSLDGIQGQYWSNARKILESRGADTSDMLILTNNGKTPIMDSNWKVTSIEKREDGHLTVHLEQLTDYTGDAADAARGAGDKLGQAWNDLVEEGRK